jgi:hypothetical protein
VQPLARALLLPPKKRMRWVLLSLLWGNILGGIQPLWGQQEARELLAAALQYPGLESFWCRDEAGRVVLSGIFANQKMSSVEPLRLWGLTIPIYNQDRAKLEPQLKIRRLRINPDRNRAVLTFTYHQRVRAHLRLRYREPEWQVKRAWIRQEAGCHPRDQGSRFVWDF